MSRLAFFFLFAYIGVVFIRPQEFVLFLNDFPLAITLECLALSCWFFNQKKLNIIEIKSVIALNIIIGISWISLSMSEGINQSLQFFFSQTLVVILISNVADSIKRHHALLILIALSAVIMSVHGILQIAADDKIGWTGIKALSRSDSLEFPVWQARYIGIFQDPNDMGMLLACAIPILFYFVAVSNSFLIRLVLIAGILTVLQGIYVANSRGTIVAVIAPIALYFLIKKNMIRAIIPLAMAIPVATLVLPSRFFISDDESSNDRIEAWYQGYLMFKSNPIIGVGKDNFTDHHFKTAHNSWVLAYAELGFLGFFFWMSMIFSALYAMYYLMSRKNTVIEKKADLEIKIDTQKEYERLTLFEKEKSLAATTFFSFIAVLASAFFLSRTYSFMLYLMPGLCAASFIRITRDFPEIKIPSVQSAIFISSIAFIGLITVIVMIKS